MTGRKGKGSKKAPLFTKDNPLCYGQLKFFVGAKIEALDSRKWYQARIVNINGSNHRVLVHFEGWNSRHDKWFDYKSESLRSLSDGEQKQHEISRRKDLQPGDRVLARWSDSKYYPAKINAFVTEKICEVIFYDGFKKRLNKNCIRPDAKRAFESFEAKYKDPLPPGSSDEDRLASPGTAAKSPIEKTERIKRRHAEPSTMADFVTTLPGKRPKHRHLGTPSDSDEYPGFPENWDGTPKERGAENQGSLHTAPIGEKWKRIAAKQKFVQQTPRVTSPESLSSVQTSSAESLSRKSAVEEYASSFVESLQSPKRKKFLGEKERYRKSMKKKKLAGDFLRIKLPLTSGKKRGRKRKLSVLVADDNSHIGDQSFSENTQGEDGGDFATSTAENSALSDLSERRTGQDEAFVFRANDSQDEEESKDTLRKGPGLKDSSPKHMSLKQKRPRGRPRDSKNRRKSAPPLEGAKTLSSNKVRLPRRERKLTEKGLELLQSIGSRRGTEGLLKESFTSQEAAEAFKSSTVRESTDARVVVNSDTVPTDSEAVTSLMVRISPLKVDRFPTEAGRGNGSAVSENNDKHEEKKTQFRNLAKNDREESVSSQRSNVEDFAELNLSSNLHKDATAFDANTEVEGSLKMSNFAKKMRSEKDLSSGKEESLVSEELDTSKEDCNEDQYSDTLSDGSGNLVIDIEDEGTRKVYIDNKESAQATERQNEVQLVGSAPDKTPYGKPRAFPRLKYTLSHEERKGNRLAKLKKVKQRLKTTKKIKSEVSDKTLNYKRVSNPLESLTKMVTEKTGFVPQTNLPVVEEAKDVPIVVENQMPCLAEESKTDVKPKASKQQRTSYKSRLKMGTSFLSMVHQDRPSQVERPFCNDLAKEKLPRSRPRSRNKQETVHGEGTSSQEDSKKKMVDPTRDLSEPLDFASLQSDRVEPAKHDRSKRDFKNPELQRNFLHPFEANAGSYGAQHIVTYAGPHSTFVGPLPRNIAQEQFDPYRSTSPQLAATHPGPVIKSEPLCFDMGRGTRAPGIVPHRGMIGGPEVRASTSEYGVPLQPMMNPHFPGPVPVPIEYGPGCVKFQGSARYDMQGSAPYPSNIVECPCQDCVNFSRRPLKLCNTSVDSEVGASISPSSDQSTTEDKMTRTVLRSPPVSGKTNEGKGDKELIITGVYSLRDSGLVSPMGPRMDSKEIVKDSGRWSVVEQTEVESSGEQAKPAISSEGKDEDPCDSDTFKDTSDDPDAVSKSPVDANENVQVTPKPKEFETKKKRLDFITGKLSAQKKSTKASIELNESYETTEEKNEASETVGDEDYPQQLVSKDSENKEQESGAMIALDSHRLVNHSSPNYVLPQTTFAPVGEPHLQSHVSCPNTDGSRYHAIQRDGHVPPYPQHILQMGPRAYIQNPDYIPPMQPIYNQQGLPPSAYQPHPRGIPYVGFPRFHQVPPFPYGSPRYVPAPGYYVPREPLQSVTTRPPPPYGTFPMSPANQRFVSIAPNGRMPTVVCKTPDCNCHLPHAASPVQISPKPAVASTSERRSPDDGTEIANAVSQTPMVNQAAPFSQKKSLKKKEALMKGDPRRLTLPLQRLKKVGVKAKEAAGSLKSKGGPILIADVVKDKNDPVEEEKKNTSETESYGNDNVQDTGDARGTDVDGNENSPNEMHWKSEEYDGREKKTEEHRMDDDTLKRDEKLSSKEKVLAPKEFVVELDLNEFQCLFKGCKKSFRKASSRDYHQRYFHTPRIPQKKRKLSSCLPSPISSEALLSPGTAACVKSHRHFCSMEGDAKTPEEFGYASSVVTDENISDRDKQEESSSDDSDESDIDSDESACVDDIIRCRCGDLEEQGFMIQCEQCFTWQHGDCVNLSVQTVPKKYLCYVCTNPEGLRNSCMYKNNFDWFKRGTLPSLVESEDKNQGRIAELMQASHALMEDIANIFEVIGGIKKKLILLNEPCHPLLQFWWRAVKETEGCEKEIKCQDTKNTTPEEGKEEMEIDGLEKEEVSMTNVANDSLIKGDDITEKELKFDDNKKVENGKDDSNYFGKENEDSNKVDNGKDDKINVKEERSQLLNKSDQAKPSKMPEEKMDKGVREKELESEVLEKRELEKQGLEKKELETKELEKKDVEKQGLEKKELEKKELERKELERKELEKKELEKRELEKKELEKKELEKKELEKKELEKKELDKQKQASQDKNVTADANANEILPNKEDATINGVETTEQETVFAKLNLLDHLDAIEKELNQRMDEIENNLDVLEQRYNDVESDSKEGETTSAFKIALPDMTSIARHLNMINRQLIDAK